MPFADLLLSARSFLGVEGLGAGSRAFSAVFDLVETWVLDGVPSPFIVLGFFADAVLFFSDPNVG